MSFTELSEQEIIRRNSLNELAKLGIEAYPAPEFQVNAHAAEIKERFDETAEPRNVVIAGRNVPSGFIFEVKSRHSPLSLLAVTIIKGSSFLYRT